jgi:hypothetical protein
LRPEAGARVRHSWKPPASTAVRGESLRVTHGLTLDGLGAVEILVSDEDVEQARILLDSAEAGQFRLPDEGEDPR